VDLYHGLYSLGHAVLWLRMHHLENIIPTTLSYDGATVAHSQTDYSAFLAPRHVILTTMLNSDMTETRKTKGSDLGTE
jgi:hypothetical protein